MGIPYALIVLVGLGSPEVHATEFEPYGFLRTDAIYNVAPFDHAQAPIVVFNAPEGFEEGGEFNLHPRLTRLGVRATGEGDDVHLEGVVEIDFQNGGRESRELIRMRHGYATLHAGDFELLFGQTWQTVSRLIPAANADSLMWGAGNTGDRSPQIRATYRIPLGDDGSVDVESAIQSQGTVHKYGQSRLNFGPTPALEERVALHKSVWDDAKPLHVAVGLHYASMDLAEKTYGETQFVQFGTFAEAQIPLTRFGWIDGEFFQGKNLADLRGGIGQGINTLTDVEIRTKGFWAQGNLTPIESLRFAGGYGSDAPNRKDISTGYPVLNRAMWGVVQVTPIEDWKVGFEVIQWSTEYKGDAILNTHRFNLNLTWTL